MKTKKLPNKLSALILLALDDLKKAERSKKYKVNMSLWHSPNSHCTVCFAGSVMAFSLGADPKQHLNPLDFNTATTCKLMALNTARAGCFHGAAECMSKSYRIQCRARVFDTAIPNYEYDRQGFHATLRKSALALQKAGL